MTDKAILYRSAVSILGPAWPVAFTPVYVLPVFLLSHKQMCVLCLNHPWRLTRAIQPAVTLPLFFSAQGNTGTLRSDFTMGRIGYLPTYKQIAFGTPHSWDDRQWPLCPLCPDCGYTESKPLRKQSAWDGAAEFGGALSHTEVSASPPCSLLLSQAGMLSKPQCSHLYNERANHPYFIRL